MRSAQLAVVVVLVSLVCSAAALKCFHCNNCGDDAGTPYQCDDQYDRCMKVQLVNRVEKTCAQKLACGLGSVERGVVTAWNKIKNFLSDVDQVEVLDEESAHIVQCCDSDYCNAAPATFLHPMMLLLPTLAFFFRL